MASSAWKNSTATFLDRLFLFYWQYSVYSKIHNGSIKMALILAAAHATTGPLKVSVYPLTLHLLNTILLLALTFPDSHLISNTFISVPRVSPCWHASLSDIFAFFHFSNSFPCLSPSFLAIPQRHYSLLSPVPSLVCKLGRQEHILLFQKTWDK